MPGPYSKQLYSSMTFQDLDRRLLLLLNEKVRKGEISQRRLALLTGFTQPHIHKILKGARRLHSELADALLCCLGLSIGHLLEGESARGEIHLRVPVWRGPLGPNRVFPDRPDESTYLLFPTSFVSDFVHPMLLQLDDDEGRMSPVIEPGDLVLVDRAKARRLYPTFDQVSVLCLNGRGAICRCQRVGGALVLATESSGRPSDLPECIAIGSQDILDVVRGIVVWACREFGVVAR